MQLAEPMLLKGGYSLSSKSIAPTPPCTSIRMVTAVAVFTVDLGVVGSEESPHTGLACVRRSDGSHSSPVDRYDSHIHSAALNPTQ